MDALRREKPFQSDFIYLVLIDISFLGVDMTPSHKNINGKFSVKYHLNLILVDEDDRRYFK
jgi:vacuolar protein sorting-associated protein 26